MAVLEKGTFSLDLGFVKLDADLSDEDRQCAWELYAEMSTRISVVGKPHDPKCSNFDGEIYTESLDSLHAFFREARGIMRRFPVGRLQVGMANHLGVLIARMLSDVIRPFLEKWHGDYRYWYESESNPKLPPFERQAQYPRLAKFLEDWSTVRWMMRRVQTKLIQAYKLVDTSKT